MIVLLLSHAQDGHLAPVAQALRERGCEPVRVDLADLPQSLAVSAALGPGGYGWRGTLTAHDRRIDLAEIRSVWWRRPTSATPPANYTAAQGAFWVRENERGLTSVLIPPPQLPGPFWVSLPDAIHKAARKPFQLAAAQAMGLDVPRTLITSDPVAVEEFYHVCGGQVICKAIVRGVLDPEGVYQPGQERFLYTSAVMPEHLAQLDRVRVMVHCFQERLRKVMDLRVIVIGKQIFTVEIHTSANAEEPVQLDWRRNYHQLRYAVHQLPPDVEQKLVGLVRFFGLQFSSLDMVLTIEGKYVFLEQNPNGQFLWPVQATGLPLAKAMADLLSSPEEYAL